MKPVSFTIKNLLALSFESVGYDKKGFFVVDTFVSHLRLSDMTITRVTTIIL